MQRQLRHGATTTFRRMGSSMRQTRLHSSFVDQQGEDFIADRWGSASKQYDRAFSAKFEAYAMEALSILDNVNTSDGKGKFLREARVLDVGCGTGAVAASLQTGEHAKALGPIKSLDAIDFSIDMVNSAKYKFDGKDSRFTFSQMDGQQLAFSDFSFEAAVAMFSVMFFPNRQAGLREMYRCLRPRGAAVIAGWGPSRSVEWIGLSNRAIIDIVGKEKLAHLFPNTDRTIPNFAVWSDLDTFTSDLEEAGFKDIKCFPVKKRFSLGSGHNAREAAVSLWYDMASSFPTLAYAIDAVETSTNYRNIRTLVSQRFADIILSRADPSGFCWLDGTAHFGVVKKPVS